MSWGFRVGTILVLGFRGLGFRVKGDELGV